MGKILVLAAHPDDEVLGCGGTITRRVREGSEVSIVIFGEGLTSRYDSRNQADKRELETLHGSAKEAGNILGVDDVRVLNLPDNRFDTVPLLDVVKRIEKLIDELTPETVYTHNGGDLNIDHSVIHRATLTATRPIAGSPVREVYSYEVPSSTEWAFGDIDGMFRPTTFVDISATLESKLKAMAAYESESRTFPHPRSSEALRAIAQRWGSTAGFKAAEPFQLIRSIVPEL